MQQQAQNVGQNQPQVNLQPIGELQPGQAAEKIQTVSTGTSGQKDCLKISDRFLIR